MNPNHIYKPGSVVALDNAKHYGDEGEEKVSPFPLQHLPPVARELAEAIARTERTPETLAGCCVLGFLSASIGAGLQITSGPSRLTRGNLYIMASAESGSGKSETFRHAAQPFFDFERDLLERWRKDTQPRLQAEAEMLVSEIGRLRKEAAKNKSSMDREELRDTLQTKKKALADLNAGLIPPALCCEDVTSEKLAVMLANNKEQLTSLSPDAGSIVNILLGRYSKNDRTDESVYLKAFSGTTAGWTDWGATLSCFSGRALRRYGWCNLTRWKPCWAKPN